jgi:hypothetical protein
MIEVSMQFTPIHTFTPEYRKPFINTPYVTPTVSTPSNPTPPLPAPPIPQLDTSNLKSTLDVFVPNKPRPITSDIALQPGIEIPLI